MLEIVLYIFLVMLCLWGIPIFAWTEKRQQLIVAGAGHFLLALIVLMVALVANKNNIPAQEESSALIKVAHVFQQPILLIYWLVVFLSIAVSKTTK